MDGARLVLVTLFFWTIFGGLLQAFDLNDYSTGGTSEFDSDDDILEKIVDLYTFDVSGLPSGVSVAITLIFSFFLGLGIYKLLPFTGD